MRRIIACCAALAIAGFAAILAPGLPASGQQQQPPEVQDSSIAQRLSKVKHIGLSVDEQLNGFNLYVYSESQQKENLEALKNYRADRREYVQLVKTLDEQRRQAQERRASRDELNAITEQRNRAGMEIRTTPFAKHILLHTVVRVSHDYIELRGAEDDTNRLLVPINRICRIRFPATQDEKASGEVRAAPN